MYKYNETLVEELVLYIENNVTLERRINAYTKHMSEKHIDGIYDREKALKGYLKHTEQGIGLYLKKYPTGIVKEDTFRAEDKQEIAERLERFYSSQFKEIQ